MNNPLCHTTMTSPQAFRHVPGGYLKQNRFAGPKHPRDAPTERTADRRGKQCRAARRHGVPPGHAADRHRWESPCLTSSRRRATPPAHTPATVVVGVDGSDGAITAVRWAASHARATGARLRLIHAVRESVSATVVLPVPGSFTAAPRRRRARPGKRVVALATAEARLFAPNVEVSGCVEPGGAVEVLVNASAGASLLVVGSRGLSRLSGSLTGSVGVQVTARAHCPTVVVRGEGDANGPVVVAVDGSQPSEPALRFAFAEAARRHAGLVAVHAWAPPVVPIGVGQTVVHTPADVPARAELGRAAGRLVTDVIASWRSAFPPVDVVELGLENGSEAALPQSTAGAVLAVVGSRGRGRLSGRTGAIAPPGPVGQHRALISAGPTPALPRHAIAAPAVTAGGRAGSIVGCPATAGTGGVYLSRSYGWQLNVPQVMFCCALGRVRRSDCRICRRCAGKSGRQRPTRPRKQERS